MLKFGGGHIPVYLGGFRYGDDKKCGYSAVARTSTFTVNSRRKQRRRPCRQTTTTTIMCPRLSPRVNDNVSILCTTSYRPGAGETINSR